MTERATSLKKVFITIVAISILSALAYSNSFGVPFVFDDYHQVGKNQHLTSLKNVPSFFYDPSADSFRNAKGYRPVLLGTFAFNYAVSRDEVWSYHLFNLLLHILNSVLVFFIISLVLEDSGRKSFLAPLVASLVFALHPMQTGAVTYISGRSAVMVSFFCLLSFISFLLYRRGDGRLKLFWAVLSPVFFILGLLTKEMAVCLPGLVMGYDFIFRKGAFSPRAIKGNAGRIKGLLYYLSYVLPVLAFLLVRKSLLGYASVDGGYSRSVYLLSQIKGLLLYLRLLVFPFNQNADYDIPASTSVDLTAVISAVLIALIFIYLFRVRKKLPALSFFGLWFFIAFAPESSIFPILDIIVEYRVYLASAGLIAAAAILVSSLEIKPGLAGKTALVSVIPLLLLLTFERNRVWGSPVSLWGDVAKKSPFSSRARANYGEALLDEKRYPEAVAELETALELYPPDERRSVIYTNMGCCYKDLNQFDAAREFFLKAIEADPTRVEADVDLGRLYAGRGQYREAAAAFSEAVRVNPLYAKAHYELACALSAMGMNGEAEAEMEKARALVN